nr:hypothetical protein [Tanacetum cinerariifolium]
MLGYTSGKVSGKEEQDKVIKGRARSTDLAKPTRQAQPNPDQARQAPGVILVVEAALTGWTLLMKVILIIGNASVALGESYDDSHSSHSYRDKDRFRHVKRRKDSESPLSSISKSDSGDGSVPVAATRDFGRPLP